MVVGIEFDLLPRQLRPEDKDYPNNAWHPQAKQPRQPTWSQIVGRALPSILPEAGSNYCAPLITEAVRTWWLHPLGRLQAIQRITQIALHLLATYGQDQPIHPADPLAKAEAAARAAIPKGFSVGDMAAAAHMPRSSLSACYRRSRGESPSIFLRRLRVDAVARFALRNNDYERMARNLGWPTKRLMAQYISRATGKSWRQWLATVKE
jgi:AraC-like DNA-binding protein